ncbi:MAG: FtsX-like permease family protein, partial [Pseudonocardiales bacterium]
GIIAMFQQQLPDAEVIEDTPIPIPGSTASVDLTAMAQHGRYSSPMLGVVSGHYPGAGEIAVTRSVLSTFSLHVGQTWTVLGQARRIVGIVQNPKNFSQPFALVAPGQIANPTSISFLTNAGPNVVSNIRPNGGQVVGIMSDGQSLAARKQQQALAVLLIATIGLTFIGLLSVAGFTVMAQRRLRSLGMIGAIGATDRQVRKVMLANGTAVGFVGATLGTVVGLVAWFALKPAFEGVVGHSIDSMSLPWLDVFLGAGLALLASIAASWWPARAVSRMPVVVALTGRPPAPQPAHRFALLGSALATLGFVLLVLSHNSKTLLIVTGIIATTGGMLLLAPLGVQALAGLSGRAPVAMRLALRALARYQARSGAALAAASLAVGISATIAITAAAQQAHDRSYTEGNLPNNQVIVWIEGGTGGPAGGPGIKAAPAPSGNSGPTAAKIATARAAAASIARSLNTTSIELDVPHNPDAPTAAGTGPGVASIVRPVTHNGRSGFEFVDQPYLATAALLNLYGISASDVHAAIITSRTDLRGTKLFDGARNGLHAITIQVQSKLPKYTSAPDALMTPNEATALGLTTQATGFVVQSAHPLTAAQIHAARTAAASAGIAVETRNATNNSLQQLRDWATFVGVLLALAVLAMTVGLIRSETSGDLRTLTAAGASGVTRRMLTATTAAALGLLGGIIGTAGAYVALIAWHWHDVSYLNQPPYLELGALVIALPVAALVGGWLFGRTPSHLGRVRGE